MYTQNAMAVMRRRYLHKKGNKSETPEEMFARVANCIAAVEGDIPKAKKTKLVESYAEIMARLDFLPNTPTLVNAGTGNGCAFAACYVLDVEDTLESVFNTIKDAALVQKSGGGVGINWSNIRPNGFIIKSTGYKTRGVLQFIRIYADAMTVIDQGGIRPAANMAILSIHHPDIVDFINMKLAGTIQNANVSVAVTEEFMKAKENSDKYNLYFPEGVKVGELDARTVWEKITTMAWRIGDPGVVWIDRVNKDNPNPSFGALRSSNPCQPGFATVLTPDGIRTFNEVKEGHTIWSGSGWTTIVSKVAAGKKSVFKYSTNKGAFIGTENHRVVSDGAKIEVKDAQTIDWAVGEAWADPVNPQDVVDGLVIGDGYVHKASNNLVLLAIGEDDGEYLDESSMVLQFIVKHRPGIRGFAYEVKTTVLANELVYKPVIEVPERFYRGGHVVKRGFLRGLYSANGSVVGNRITLKATSSRLIEQVQEMLSSVGIASYITVNASKTIQWANGEYTSKESYDLNIASHREVFMQTIGFIQSYKNERYAKITTGAGRCKSGDVKSIVALGEHEVYDITVDCEEHTYWTGGLLVGNCGETFLLPGESCVLGSINLVNMLKKKIDTESHVTYEWDMEKIDKTVPLAIRFLDGVINASPQPLQAIADATMRTRKIGLGVMGFADALIKMGIAYNSMRGLEHADCIMKYINDKAMEVSIELGKEKGVFPSYELDKIGPPRRNAIVTTIAPTGSISAIAGVSSGIEPIYAVAYTRKAFGDTELFEFQAELEGQLKQRNLYTKELAQSIADEHKGSIQGTTLPDDLKKVFVTAHDISPEWHVRMQAQFQKHTGNSISKTINMKNEASVQEVDDAFMLSHQLGCKGVTVYRDGSKDVQVLTTNKSVVSVRGDEHGPRARIEDPSGRTYEVPFGYGDALITVNEDDIGMCEVIIKAGKSGTPVAAEAEELGRLISLLLRSGVAVKYIMKQIRGISAGEVAFYKGRTITGLGDAVAYAMEAFLLRKNPKGGRGIKTVKESLEEVSYKQVCPDCGSLVLHTSRCIECPNPECGWSKCR